MRKKVKKLGDIWDFRAKNKVCKSKNTGIIDTTPCRALSAVFLGLRDPLWPEVFENLPVGLIFNALQNGKQPFLKFDPWAEIWHLEVTHFKCDICFIFKKIKTWLFFLN